MKKIALLMITAGLFIFNACTKTGPQGPQGPQGPMGPQGPAGPAGPAGTVVDGSNPFTVSSWSTSGSIYYADFLDAAITPDVVDFGIVEVYKSYGTNEWTNLPDISGITSTVFNFYDGGFSIYVQNSNGTLPAHPGSVTFRTVVVTPSLRQAYPNTNWKNYKEAVEAINASKAIKGTPVLSE